MLGQGWVMRVDTSQPGTWEGAGQPAPSARPRTVLIVEDAPEDREMVERLLRRLPEASYEVRAASVGGEGLEAIRSGLASGTPPDCVLLDFHLPDMTALEFLERVSEVAPEGRVLPPAPPGAPTRLPLPIVVRDGSVVPESPCDAVVYVLTGGSSPDWQPPPPSSSAQANAPATNKKRRCDQRLVTVGWELAFH